MPRSAGQINHGILRPRQLLRITGNPALLHSQVARKALRIRHKPSLYFAHSDSKAKVRSRIRYPDIAHQRSALRIVIQVNEHQPGCITSRIVIAIDPVSQGGFTILAIYDSDPSACMRNKSARNDLVDHALDRCGYGNG